VQLGQGLGQSELLRVRAYGAAAAGLGLTELAKLRVVPCPCCPSLLCRTHRNAVGWTDGQATAG